MPLLAQPVEFFPTGFYVVENFAQEAAADIFAFMHWHNSTAAIRMAQENMASLLANTFKAKAGEYSDNFGRFERNEPAHAFISWMPTNLRWETGSFWVSRQSRIASLILLSKEDISFAWVWQPFKAGTEATSIPSSSRSIIARNSLLFVFILPITSNNLNNSITVALSQEAAVSPSLPFRTSSSGVEGVPDEIVLARYAGDKRFKRNKRLAGDIYGKVLNESSEEERKLLRESGFMPMIDQYAFWMMQHELDILHITTFVKNDISNAVEAGRYRSKKKKPDARLRERMREADRILKRYLRDILGDSIDGILYKYKPLLGHVRFVRGKAIPFERPHVGYEVVAEISDTSNRHVVFPSRGRRALFYLVHEGLHLNSTRMWSGYLEEGITHYLTLDTLLKYTPRIAHDYHRMIAEHERGSLRLAAAIAEDVGVEQTYKAYFLGDEREMDILPVEAALANLEPERGNRRITYNGKRMRLVQLRRNLTKDLPRVTTRCGKFVRLEKDDKSNIVANDYNRQGPKRKEDIFTSIVRCRPHGGHLAAVLGKSDAAKNPGHQRRVKKASSPVYRLSQDMNFAGVITGVFLKGCSTSRSLSPVTTISAFASSAAWRMKSSSGSRHRSRGFPEGLIYKDLSFMTRNNSLISLASIFNRGRYSTAASSFSNWGVTTKINFLLRKAKYIGRSFLLPLRMLTRTLLSIMTFISFIVKSLAGFLANAGYFFVGKIFSFEFSSDFCHNAIEPARPGFFFQPLHQTDFSFGRHLSHQPFNLISVQLQNNLSIFHSFLPPLSTNKSYPYGTTALAESQALAFQASSPSLYKNQPSEPGSVGREVRASSLVAEISDSGWQRLKEDISQGNSEEVRDAAIILGGSELGAKKKEARASLNKASHRPMLGIEAYNALEIALQRIEAYRANIPRQYCKMKRDKFIRTFSASINSEPDVERFSRVLDEINNILMPKYRELSFYPTACDTMSKEAYNILRKHFFRPDLVAIYPGHLLAQRPKHVIVTVNIADEEFLLDCSANQYERLNQNTIVDISPVLIPTRIIKSKQLEIPLYRDVANLLEQPALVARSLKGFEAEKPNLKKIDASETISIKKAGRRISASSPQRESSDGEFDEIFSAIIRLRGSRAGGVDKKQLIGALRATQTPEQVELNIRLLVEGRYLEVDDWPNVKGRDFTVNIVSKGARVKETKAEKPPVKQLTKGIRNKRTTKKKLSKKKRPAKKTAKKQLSKCPAKKIKENKSTAKKQSRPKRSYLNSLGIAVLTVLSKSKEKHGLTVVEVCKRLVSYFDEFPERVPKRLVGCKIIDKGVFDGIDGRWKSRTFESLRGMRSDKVPPYVKVVQEEPVYTYQITPAGGEALDKATSSSPQSQEEFAIIPELESLEFNLKALIQEGVLVSRCPIDSPSRLSEVRNKWKKLADKFEQLIAEICGSNMKRAVNNFVDAASCDVYDLLQDASGRQGLIDIASYCASVCARQVEIVSKLLQKMEDRPLLRNTYIFLSDAFEYLNVKYAGTQFVIRFSSSSSNSQQKGHSAWASSPKEQKVPILHPRDARGEGKAGRACPERVRRRWTSRRASSPANGRISLDEYTKRYGSVSSLSFGDVILHYCPVTAFRSADNRANGIIGYLPQGNFLLMERRDAEAMYFYSGPAIAVHGDENSFTIKGVPITKAIEELPISKDKSLLVVCCNCQKMLITSKRPYIYATERIRRQKDKGGFHHFVISDNGTGKSEFEVEGRLYEYWVDKEGSWQSTQTKKRGNENSLLPIFSYENRPKMKCRKAAGGEFLDFSGGASNSSWFNQEFKDWQPNGVYPAKPGEAPNKSASQGARWASSSTSKQISLAEYKKLHEVKPVQIADKTFYYRQAQSFSRGSMLANSVIEFLPLGRFLLIVHGSQAGYYEGPAISMHGDEGIKEIGTNGVPLRSIIEKLTKEELIPNVNSLYVSVCNPGRVKMSKGDIPCIYGTNVVRREPWNDGVFDITLSANGIGRERKAGGYVYVESCDRPGEWKTTQPYGKNRTLLLQPVSQYRLVYGSAIESSSPGRSMGCEQQVVLENREHYLKQTPLCDWGDKAIMRRAKVARENNSTDSECAKDLWRWVKRVTHYSVGYGAYWDAPASETFKTKTGMCFNAANLLVAVARAANIPARYRFVELRKEALKGILPLNYLNLMGEQPLHIFASLFLDGHWQDFDMQRSFQFDITDTLGHSAVIDKLALRKARIISRRECNALEDERRKRAVARGSRPLLNVSLFGRGLVIQEVIAEFKKQHKRPLLYDIAEKIQDIAKSDSRIEMLTIDMVNQAARANGIILPRRAIDKNKLLAQMSRLSAKYQAQNGNKKPTFKQLVGLINADGPYDQYTVGSLRRWLRINGIPRQSVPIRKAYEGVDGFIEKAIAAARKIAAETGSQIIPQVTLRNKLELKHPTLSMRIKVINKDRGDFYQIMQDAGYTIVPRMHRARSIPKEQIPASSSLEKTYSIALAPASSPEQRKGENSRCPYFDEQSAASSSNIIPHLIGGKAGSSSIHHSRNIIHDSAASAVSQRADSHVSLGPTISINGVMFSVSGREVNGSGLILPDNNLVSEFNNQPVKWAIKRKQDIVNRLNTLKQADGSIPQPTDISSFMEVIGRDSLEAELRELESLMLLDLARPSREVLLAFLQFYAYATEEMMRSALRMLEMCGIDSGFLNRHYTAIIDRLAFTVISDTVLEAEIIKYLDSKKNEPVFLVKVLSPDSRATGAVRNKARELLGAISISGSDLKSWFSQLLAVVDRENMEKTPLAELLIEHCLRHYSDLSDTDNRHLLHILDRLPDDSYQDGIPGIPEDFTFGIELETGILLSLEKLDTSFAAGNMLREHLSRECKGAIKNNWVVKMDQSNAEITTPDNGIPNTAADISRFKGFLSDIVRALQSFKLNIQCNGSVRSVAFSADGRHIVSGSDDKALKLWDRDEEKYRVSSARRNSGRSASAVSHRSISHLAGGRTGYSEPGSEKGSIPFFSETITNLVGWYGKGVFKIRGKLRLIAIRLRHTLSAAFLRLGVCRFSPRSVGAQYIVPENKMVQNIEPLQNDVVASISSSSPNHSPFTIHDSRTGALVYAGSSPLGYCDEEPVVVWVPLRVDLYLPRMIPYHFDLFIIP